MIINHEVQDGIVNDGCVSLVILSLFDTPESESESRSGIPGALSVAAGFLKILIVGDGADIFPAVSVAVV